MAVRVYGSANLLDTLAHRRVSTTALANSDYEPRLILLPSRVRRGADALAARLKAHPEAVYLAAMELGLRLVGTSAIIEAQRRVDPLMDHRTTRTP